MTADKDLATALDDLIKAITFDDSGENGKGGNGGLISRETIRKADEARIVLAAYRRRQGRFA